MLTTTKKAIAIFVSLGYIYDRLNQITDKDIVMCADDEDETVASNLFYILNECNCCEFGHELFSSIISLSHFLFDTFIFEKKEYSVKNVMKEFEKVMNLLIENFDEVKNMKGNRLSDEECLKCLEQVGIN